MILDKIKTDLNQALKSGDSLRVSVLRFLLSQIKNVEIQKCPPGSGKTLSEEDVAAVVQKSAKERNESIEMFKKGGRQDLVDKENQELAILKEYLPEQMPEEEVRRVVKEVIGGGVGDFGQVMGQVMGKVKGKTDGATVSRIVKEELAS